MPRQMRVKIPKKKKSSRLEYDWNTSFKTKSDVVLTWHHDRFKHLNLQYIHRIFYKIAKKINAQTRICYNLLCRKVFNTCLASMPGAVSMAIWPCWGNFIVLELGIVA